MKEKEFIECSRCRRDYSVEGLVDEDLVYVDAGLYVIDKHPCPVCGCDEGYLL